MNGSPSHRSLLTPSRTGRPRGVRRRRMDEFGHATVLALTALMVLSAVAFATMMSARRRLDQRDGPGETQARYLAYSALILAAASDFLEEETYSFETGEVRIRDATPANRKEKKIICDVESERIAATIETGWKKEGNRWRARYWTESK